jgi:hypothetical protein
MMNALMFVACRVLIYLFREQKKKIAICRAYEIINVEILTEK